MRLTDLAKVVEGQILNFERDLEVNSFTIDSRKSSEGGVFIPLKGTTDGHNYIEDALNRGSVGYLTEKSLNFKNGILVKDTYQALKKIAIYKRKSIDTVVGITGSSGKTSTKELLNFVLSKFYKTHSTSGNYNNEIGVPLTLSNTPENTHIAIIEMGAGKVGDIDYLNEIVNPDVAVLVSVGHAHVEKFGSFENIIKGKGEIFNKAHYHVLPFDLLHHYKDKLKKFITFGEEGDIKVYGIRITPEGTAGKIAYKNQVLDLTIPIFNKGVFKNTGAVAGVLYHLGLDPIKSLEVLKDFSQIEGRGKILKIGNITIIDDSYNANPLSVKNAIETLNEIPTVKVLVLGDMLELGKESEKLHRNIAREIVKTNIDYVFLYGEETKYIKQDLEGKKPVIYADKKEIAYQIKKLENLNPTVLIKGSRGMKMEEVIKYLGN
ncbi:UDP-N-acetylmuramoyl-tripeptide--D-alanyl-D-alanine ligase [Sulfurihydrogenibium subterraneum]|uniref:UDP-N-acetylmuramoyl-tripeptide--D-alanyl-D- alanine ligase n=1 Tax=Sulfurihydrogenibium subterraneum TaxID=171121 RepID=UPI000491C417|nr:UDP-N-acetylmuramoyl-tripeptide--D-alanyl-D-alanine ligase [Sulfurihydrogenibium subterraneum]